MVCYQHITPASSTRGNAQGTYLVVSLCDRSHSLHRIHQLLQLSCHGTIEGGQAQLCNDSPSLAEMFWSVAAPICGNGIGKHSLSVTSMKIEVNSQNA